ncbi:NADP-dependent oxidoreductase [Kosakonia sp. YIM B13611]|uniref:NADP-dependent oxidoreductase n=1 Tax=unclassified Kosakonia TaxID=2632876 RepID=UPI0036A617EE
MKVIRYHAFGGPDELRVDEIPVPHAGPGEIRIAVHCAGVNPSDWKRREGQYKAFEDVVFPLTVGVEASGIVDEIGDGVSGVAIGDAVFGFGDGTFAEKAILTHWAAKPVAVSFEVAAGLPVIVDTATRALDEVNIETGQTLLVSGAAGGVGTAIVQLAHLRGIIVIGSASSPKHDYLVSLGAIPTTYGPGLKERITQLAPMGVDAAIDVAGSGVIPELISIVGNPARVLSVADFSAEQYGAKFSHGPPEQPEIALAKIARLCAGGLFTLPIQGVYPLQQTADAHRVSAEGHVTGKLVIKVR